jgi:hypothetical protein
MEKWKDIIGFEGRYQISNMGNVMSLKYKRGKRPKLLSPSINGEGYKNVSLRDGFVATNRTIHTLVAEYFIPNPLGLPQVNHKDGDKLNCQEDNLEWSTSGDNTRHYHKYIRKYA